MKDLLPHAPLVPRESGYGRRQGGVLRLALVFLATVGLGAAPALAVDVGKWKRHALSLSNPSYTGNPFELELDATFTHTASGESLTLPGYYAGGDQWKVGFMPTRTGEWTWETSSADPELDGKTGSLTCVASGLPGMLVADSSQPKKWRLSDGEYVVPMGFRVEFFSEPASDAVFEEAAEFLRAEVGGHMYETRLLEEYGMFGDRHDFIFAGNWQDHQFDLEIWDRMERRMEMLAERGLGAHVMLYSDDGGEPGWAGQSATEALVIRYVVARLAGYPILWFNTGIDIAEYRSQSDIDWLGDRIRSLDPYGHPVSSRRGGGSGDMAMAGRTFESYGDNRAEIGDILERYHGSSIPASMDDAWGENRDSHPAKNHTEHDIRRAFWKCLVAGGVGGLVRGGGDGLSRSGFFSISKVESDLESEQWLRLVNPFLADDLGALFSSMEPRSDLVAGTQCYALSDPQEEKILYLLVGENDTYDPGGGGDVTVKLGSLSANYGAEWFNPRTGQKTSIGTLAGGQNHVLTPPSRDDWVMLLVKGGGGEPDPPPPNVGGLRRTDQ